MLRAMLVCPGRGAYAKAELGWLNRFSAGNNAAQTVIRQADGLRQSAGRPLVSALDARADFSAATFLVGENAAALTFTATAVDLARLDADKVRPVCAVGNSMGWYSALYAAGALSFAETFTVIDEMGHLQGLGSGGQVLYPMTGDDWRIVPERVEAVERALADTGASWSIHLGGIAVLAGTDAQLAALLKALPPVKSGAAEYPFRLPRHAAFHTPLMAEMAAAGRAKLSGLDWRAPLVSMIDGRGAIVRPRIADPAELFGYTLGHQVVEPYDFTASVRVGLREFAPDVLVLLGPGESLGAPVGQILVQEGWQGIRSKAEFLDRQRSSTPLVVSMARPEQAAFVS